jgi:hypothetical protein
MNDRSQPAGWRATAWAAALFAITLNFLQPLVHAAAMRDGATSALWTAFCNAAPDSRQDAPLPAASGKHECCLGLAHAVAFTAPAMAALLGTAVAVAVRPLEATEIVTSVGIRDGPHRPRGPPAFA